MNPILPAQEYQLGQINRRLKITCLLGVMSTIISAIFWICIGLLHLPRLNASLFLTLPILFLPPIITWITTPLSIINIIIACYEMYQISKLNSRFREYKTAFYSLIINFIPIICILILDIVIGLSNLNSFYTNIL